MQNRVSGTAIIIEGTALALVLGLTNAICDTVAVLQLFAMKNFKFSGLYWCILCARALFIGHLVFPFAKMQGHRCYGEQKGS